MPFCRQLSGAVKFDPRLLTWLITRLREVRAIGASDDDRTAEVRKRMLAAARGD